MRLFLFAALAALSAAWSIPFLSSDTEPSSELRLHPLSPPVLDPKLLRLKRQAYLVNDGNDLIVTVDKSGIAESGPWGPWSLEAECSRTCGGGVQKEKRACSSENKCTGHSIRFSSCNLDACPEENDFRSEQCAANNDHELNGKYYKWQKRTGSETCELLCKAVGEGFYYKFGDVVDGTSCKTTYKESGICVMGDCIQVGCDGKLGSTKKLDKCGVCDGDSSTCKTVQGAFDERNLSPGYHDIIKLPEGTTSIRITKLRVSSMNLALKNSSDQFILNGNNMIQEDHEVEAAGTVFEYDDKKQEKITAAGPLTDEVTVALLFRKGSKASAIEYEFSVPLEKAPFVYKPGDWSPCSVTCGKGVQTRTPFCLSVSDNQRVADEVCDENNSTKPDTERECKTVDCEAEWFVGEWETCSATCGEKGEQYRVIYCHQVFANGRRITVDDGNCTAGRPEVRQTCNRFACPEWHAGPWSACSEKCGDAFQYRSVTCRSEKEGEEGKLLPADACPTGEELESKRDCNLGPCEGLKFYTTEWKLCSRCNDTEETREVTCKDKMGRAYPLEKCLPANTTETIPIDTRSCATQPPCTYEWTTSAWSKCSTECGHGHQTRRVVCAIHQEGDLEVVSEHHCVGEKPEGKMNCTNEEKCTGTWFSGPWTKCSAECDGGSQTRITVCLNYDHKPEPKWCDETEKPKEEQECNADPCPTCFDSEFGCCPDNSTFATGDFFAGCSNCSLAEFGCCADNVTEAIGANAKGCPEYVEVEEGSAEEITEEKEKSCELKADNGTTVSVNCDEIKDQVILEDSDLLGNDTTNGTHCSKTEFGCCPDWYTPASGKNFEGCETFVLGTCNGTQFGCCPDEVTLARGSNYEGCGEASCAASLFGCCKDRTTIAFGPHYAGCERSSFPCELSAFGCCPDGETAALGKNGTGCGENCLTTRFGCCPDGKTVSKGVNNEGCGCEFAQYGCCPDGKSTAKGAAFYGCPESCAQSQFGCCPDGKTAARGAQKEGCPCQYTRYGCCPDGETTALGPRNDGCDDCRYAKYSCCPDGVTKARGPDNAGCPSTTPMPFLSGGTVSPLAISACSLPQDQGKTCAVGYKLVWYYDVDEARCSQFWYGGCLGNENRFATKEQCELTCVEPPGKGRCYLPQVMGGPHCSQPEARYHYDPKTQKCTGFWWRGCLGNSNNFPSWEECSNECRGVLPPDVTTTPAPQAYAPPVPQNEIRVDIATEPQEVVEQPRPPVEGRRRPNMEEVCSSPADPGQCTDYNEKYHFSTATNKCERFHYGGCGGNLNNFGTEEECLMRCSFMQGQSGREVIVPTVRTDISYPGGGIVQPPPDYSRGLVSSVSMTKAPVARPQPYGFSTPYNFATYTASSGKTRSSCFEKLDIGRCEGSFPSFYYEVATGNCVGFSYTGCGGNSNRFATIEECQGICQRSEQSVPRTRVAPPRDGGPGANSVCDERRDSGKCPPEMKSNHTYSTKWYYDKDSGVCTRFHYAGCGGTGNRFDTEVDCKSACQNHISACELPPVRGVCSGNHESFFYNKQTGVCEKFLYSGCLGNINRFSTIEECQARCPRNGQSSDALRSSNLLPTPQALIQSDAPLAKCQQPKDTGNCRASIPSYFYDSLIGKCLPFIYGGCGGNTNRFETKEDCQRECQPEKFQALRLPRTQRHQMEEAPRPSALLRHTVSLETNRIQEDQEHIHDVRVIGEEATPNFREQAEHIDTTQWISVDQPSIYTEHHEILNDDQHTHEHLRETPIQAGQPEESDHETEIVPQTPIPELCLLPEEQGRCYGNDLRWRYDESTGSCRSFLYTGCDANANNFESQEACERACGAFRDVQVCAVPSDAGECSTRVMKWTYHRDRRECRPMWWSGCGGNGNRFSSKSECEMLCRAEEAVDPALDVCSLRYDAGPCSDAVTQWHFDASLGECRQFTYGGCRGNPNRFDTKEGCEKRCTRTQRSTHVDPKVCRLPVDVGPCVDRSTRFFFDHRVRKCRPFLYGGCQGNENRFESESECLSACLNAVDIPADLPTPVHVPPRRSAIARTHGNGPFQSGSEIKLMCNSTEKPIVWWKNGDLLKFTERIVESRDFEEVTIYNASPQDSGNYICAVGPDGILSEKVHVHVKELPVTDSDCIDRGDSSTCKKILSFGLCKTERYAKFCCQTCGKQGFPLFRF